MSQSPNKTHFADDLEHFPLCGLSGPRVSRAAEVTCLICRRKLIEAVAPWAKSFLKEASGRQLALPLEGQT